MNRNTYKHIMIGKIMRDTDRYDFGTGLVVGFIAGGIAVMSVIAFILCTM